MTTRRPDYDGLLRWTVVRPDRYVGVYDGREAGLDISDGRWATVCEAHGTILNHATRQRAIQHRFTPEAWCDQCRAELHIS